MTRQTNARVAGVTFLFYIAVALAPTPNPGWEAVTTLGADFSALILGVTLYAITREQDRDLAMLAMVCRIGEGVLGAMFIPATLALQKSGTPELKAFYHTAGGWNPIVGATFFAVGSTLFAWLMLRGRMIPAALAWLGVFASVLLVVGLPLQLAGVLTGTITYLMWIPAALFEIPLGFWFIIKGVNPAPAP